MLEHALLYLIPIKGDSGSKPGMTCGGEFLKIQPGTGDNLSPEDIAQGYTDYVIWNRFRAEELDIDGELPVECVDSGMLLLKEGPTSIATAASQPRNDMQVIKRGSLLTHLMTAACQARRAMTLQKMFWSRRMEPATLKQPSF